MNQLAPIALLTNLPALIGAAGERVSLRFLKFFAANKRRDAGEPLREIAQSYNVSHSTISRLVA